MSSKLFSHPRKKNENKKLLHYIHLITIIVYILMEAVTMDGQRKSDKTEPFKIILSLISPIFLAIILYIIVPLKSEVKDLRQEFNNRFDKHENSQESSNAKIEERFTTLYNTCMDEIKDIRKETTSQYNEIKDQLIAMLKYKKVMN
jgi:hypothetical protein